MLTPIIQIFPERLFVGYSLEMSLANDQTRNLFQSFMPSRSRIKNPISDSVFLLKLYPKGYFENFDPLLTFTKIAALETDSLEQDSAFQSIIVPEGLYARFLNTSGPNNHSIYSSIFSEWMPNSEFELANRPHLDCMNSDYLNGSSNIEDILIPIQVRTKK